GDGPAVDGRGSACVGGQTGQGRDSTDDAAEGGRAGAVGGQAEGAVERIAKGDVPDSGAHDGIGPQGHRIVIGLHTRGGDGPAVDGRGSACVGDQTGQGRDSTDDAAKRGR